IEKGTIGFGVRSLSGHYGSRRRLRHRRRQGPRRGARLCEQHGRAGTGNGGGGNQLLHFVSALGLLVCVGADSAFFCASAFRASASSGGTGAGSFDPRCISSRKVAMTSSRESRRGFQVRESLLFPGGGGGSGFSASSSGVRL